MILKDGTIDNDKFGQELVLDLYGCDPKKITDGEYIKQFVIKLCDEVIMMKRYGEPQVPFFGEETPITAGYSLVQLIETSLVSAHFSEYKKAVYLNIFSCKWFDAEAAAEFAAKWFDAKEIRRNNLMKRD
jgi:S-adenosylmethionine decarboxylase